MQRSSTQKFHTQFIPDVSFEYDMDGCLIEAQVMFRNWFKIFPTHYTCEEIMDLEVIIYIFIKILYPNPKKIKSVSIKFLNIKGTNMYRVASIVLKMDVGIHDRNNFQEFHAELIEFSLHMLENVLLEYY